MDKDTIALAGVRTTEPSREILDMFGRRMERSSVKAGLETYQGYAKQLLSLIEDVKASSHLRQYAVDYVNATGDNEFALTLADVQDNLDRASRWLSFETASGAALCTGSVSVSCRRFEGLAKGGALTGPVRTYTLRMPDLGDSPWCEYFSLLNQGRSSETAPAWSRVVHLNYDALMKNISWDDIATEPQYAFVGGVSEGELLTYLPSQSLVYEIADGGLVSAPPPPVAQLEPAKTEPPSMITSAKSELQEWLQCNKEHLAQLLGMTRQTLFTAGEPGHRVQPRVASAILDAHALIAGYLKVDKIERLAWLRNQGRRLWEQNGFDTFDRFIMERTADRASLPVIGTIDVDDEDAVPPVARFSDGESR